MTIWFSADTHFNHWKICEYCSRPFSSVQEMNETLINNWNAVVQPTDTVYHLGDVGFWKRSTHKEVDDLLGKLHGVIHLVKGNHDKGLDSQHKWRFSSAEILSEINIARQNIVLCHYPLRSWNRSSHWSYMLHGHCHNSLPEDPNLLSVDVGVDRWGYTPVSFETIDSYMQKKLAKIKESQPTSYGPGSLISSRARINSEQDV